jgi:hypothetical protein
MVGFQLVLFAAILMLKKARRNERGQKAEEVYVIEDKQLQNVGPGGQYIVEERRFTDPKALGAVM